MADEKKYIGHCVQCKGKKELVDPVPYKMRNTKTKNMQVNMVKGRCPTCNHPVYVVVGHS